MFNQSVFLKKIREVEKKGDLVHIFNNNKTFLKYDSKLSTEINFYSGIETTLIIYQIKARIKLHIMIMSTFGKSFLYPNSIVYITYLEFKSFDAPFLLYFLPILFNRAIKGILVPT